VKKISGHITKKVADRLSDIFKKNRDEFEKKWDDLKLFIEYGMISDEKFYEKASKFALLKTTDDKYFTYEEYEKLIKENQTDKNKNLIYLYSTDKTDQFTYIDKAKSKGYDILLLDGQLDIHLVNYLEGKFKDSRFVRVDSDVIDKLIQKDEGKESKLTPQQQDDLKSVFQGQLKLKDHYIIVFEALDENDAPVIITRSEFMRRMKEMSQFGGGMSFYGDLPDSFNLVVNSRHALIEKLSADLYESVSEKLKENDPERTRLNEEIAFMEKEYKKKKEEEVSQLEKDDLGKLRKELDTINNNRKDLLEGYGNENKIVRQLIDLGLLANNMLRGEELSTFVKRSVELL
jgi:molecular chaperone HtpG